MIALAAMLLGCTEEWRNADIQVDIEGAEWADTDVVRVCLDGFGVLEQALGAGRVALTGVAVGTDGELNIDILAEEGTEQRQGRAGPIWLGDGPSWQEVTWEPCTQPPCTACTGSGQRVSDDVDSWLVALRFQ